MSSWKRWTILFIVLIVVGCFVFLIIRPELKYAETKKDTTSQFAEVKLDQIKERKLSIFLSNFTETRLPFFRLNQIKNYDLISFGIIHVLANTPQYIESVDNLNERIASKYIEAAVYKYFKKKIRNTSISGGYSYKDGYYYKAKAGGEPSCFARIDKLLDMNNSQYLAYATVYCPGNDFTGDPFGPMEEWERSADIPVDIPTVLWKIKAKIQLIKENNIERYILLEYLEDK